MSRRLIAGAICPGLLALVLAPATAQQTELDDIVARTGRYVREFIPRFANVVAAEEYEQRVRSFSNIASAQALGTSAGDETTWRLQSEVLLVRYPLGELDWVMFRDVAVVNGKPLREQQDRLMQLFIAPTVDALQRAAAISQESTRYHVPGASYQITNPLIALALMQPHYHPRMRFRPGRDNPSLADGVRTSQFEEVESRETAAVPTEAKGPPPTLLGTIERVRGTVWAEQTTGRIVRTELRITERRKLSISTTTFAHDARLDLTVPVEMRTEWENPKTVLTSYSVQGTAKYSNYRRFQADAGPVNIVAPAPR